VNKPLGDATTMADNNIVQRIQEFVERVWASVHKHPSWELCVLTVTLCQCPYVVVAQASPSGDHSFEGQTPGISHDYNKKLEQLYHRTAGASESDSQNYRIGSDDLLELTVFEAPDLNRTVRVSANGDISLPLLGNVRAADLTTSELEASLEELLRRTYMKEPHVGVFLKEIQSHAVSVFGAVKRPGVIQIRGTKSLVEVLSMAEGLADDAGDTVIIMRGAEGDGLSEGETPLGTTNLRSSAEGVAAISRSGTTREPAAQEINLKNLLESGDPSYNVPVNPGDVVKVTRAGVVYVVGEVHKPGGFTLKTNENISVLQALALAEGLTRTSAKGKARIIRTDELSGARAEIPIDLGKILGGKAADPQLRAKDIVFVPNSGGRTALYRGSEAALSIAGGVIIYRR
jgi:polysaccharide export outer membrane protein